MKVPKIFGRKSGRATQAQRREIAERVSVGIAHQEAKKLLARKGQYSPSEIRKAFVERELPVRVRISTKIAMDRLGIEKGDMKKRQRIHEIMGASVERERLRESLGIKMIDGDRAQETLAGQLLKELGSRSVFNKFKKYHEKEMRRFLPLNSIYAEVGIKRAYIENIVRAWKVPDSKVKK